MSEPDAEVVERLFEALSVYRERGVDAWAEILHPEVEWEVAEDVANSCLSSGPGEVVRSAESWEDAWAKVDYEPGEIVGEGSRAVVEMRVTMTGQASGIPMDGTLWWAFELREGLVVRGGIYQGRERALARVGL